MPRRKVVFKCGEYYHVYNRGHNRDDIFFEKDDYFLFLRKLREFVVEEVVSADGSKRRSVEVIAYCLMTNHYHLLVRLIDEDFSRRMQAFGQAVVNSLNRRRARESGLFQGPFQAKHVDEPEYLAHLTRYIHLNPVAAGLVSRPSEWEFSSYREYLGTRAGTLPTAELVIREFGSRERYQRFVEDTVAYPDGMDGFTFDE
jgi:REP element-mobilizing transposase RayT